MSNADLESAGWSGEGTFTAVLIDRLREMPSVVFVRVEDSPSSRTDADYNFISNEVYVRFRTEPRSETSRWLGIIPLRRTVQQPVMTLADLEGHLTTLEDVGPPDYSDEGMMQYLKTERIIPPYQTRGYKIVEMVRIYALAV